MRRAFRLAPYVEKIFNEVSKSHIKLDLFMFETFVKIQENLENERVELDQRFSSHTILTHW